MDVMLRTFTKLAVVVSAVVAASLASAELKWHTKYEDALAEAKKTKKVILADFTGSDWCGWCIKLKKEVFNTPEFEKWAKANVVLLELDFPQKKKQPAAIEKQNEKLAEKYKIEGFPTILFMDATGKEVARYGYDSGGPANWTKKAEAMIKKKA